VNPGAIQSAFDPPLTRGPRFVFRVIQRTPFDGFDPGRASVHASRGIVGHPGRIRADADARAPWLLVVISVLIVLGAISSAGTARAEARRGMVSSVHPVATEAGLRVLKEGGNAIDAAVAVGLTLGVVDSYNSGIGGGCFILIRRADGALAAIDGREIAPAAATSDMFMRNGKADTALSQTGPLASAVPGALAAYEFAVERYGKMRLKDLILPAADIADRGFRLDAGYARNLERVTDELARFAASREVFFKGGKPLRRGQVLRQPHLAATYRSIAVQGSDWFYRGPFAQATEAWMKSNGGVMTAADFRNYQIRLREPVTTSYRGYQIVTFPPPSSGGVHIAQVLKILQNFDLAAFDPATRLHVIAEAMKLAFADRMYWLGDPEFANVPHGLVDASYGAALAGKINTEHVAQVKTHGLPPNWQGDFFKKHTTHFSIADSEGNWVACTATVNTSFGSKVVIPGTGVVMNDEMDDFSIQPGVTNYFGLIGAYANAVAPGKRPLSSMGPTLVLKEGQPTIALGAAGGPSIISQVVLELVGMLDLGLNPAEALAQPRIHHQWFPDELMVEKSLPRKLQNDLVRRGHKLKILPSMGVSQIVARSPDGQGFTGAADPRAGGRARGW
jgi:gamma-glutamyltranspeptidase / glutathione hydrolase